jgi:aquaporin related protein
MGIDDSLFGPHSRAQVLQMALAELVGTGMLVFLGCMGTVVGMSHSPHPHLLVALAFGLAVMICIQVSEHLQKSYIAPDILTHFLSTVSLTIWTRHFLSRS